MPLRPIRIDGDIAYVPLTKGYEAIIDAQDVPLVGDRPWTASVVLRKDGTVRTVYAVRNDGGRRIYLHRLILQPAAGMDVDHLSGNGLDCRRSNMRDATREQNVRNQRQCRRNTSGFKGVTWSAPNGKWRAQIGHKGKCLFLGYFADKADAASAYRAASTSLHKEFGRIA